MVDCNAWHSTWGCHPGDRLELCKISLKRGSGIILFLRCVPNVDGHEGVTKEAEDDGVCLGVVLFNLPLESWLLVMHIHNGATQVISWFPSLSADGSTVVVRFSTTRADFCPVSYVPVLGC